MNVSVASRPLAPPAFAPQVPAGPWLWLTAVLLPFVIGRGIVLLLAADAASVRGLGGLASWAVWDGAWYAQIARDGYDFVLGTGETPYPFFPLFPGLMRGGTFLGLSPVATALLANHLLFLAALGGLLEIARAHGNDAEALLACWSLALYPGSAPLTLVYPCTLFLACGVWSFLLLERGRDGAASIVAALAALTRPNGLVVPAALGCAALLQSRAPGRALRVVLPAGVAVAAWLAWLWVRTGDPLTFVHAKGAWHEVTLASLLAGHDRLPKLDLAPLAFAALVIGLAWRRIPSGWLILAAATLLPSLALGVLGMPRYTAACFPVFFACGVVLARLPRAARVAVLAGFAGGLLFLGRRILLTEHMP